MADKSNIIEKQLFDISNAVILSTDRSSNSNIFLILQSCFYFYRSFQHPTNNTLLKTTALILSINGNLLQGNKKTINQPNFRAN